MKSINISLLVIAGALTPLAAAAPVAAPQAPPGTNILPGPEGDKPDWLYCDTPECKAEFDKVFKQGKEENLLPGDGARPRPQPDDQGTFPNPWKPRPDQPDPNDPNDDHPQPGPTEPDEPPPTLVPGHWLAFTEMDFKSGSKTMSEAQGRCQDIVDADVLNKLYSARAAPNMHVELFTEAGCKEPKLCVDPKGWGDLSNAPKYKSFKILDGDKCPVEK